MDRTRGGVAAAAGRGIIAGGAGGHQGGTQRRDTRLNYNSSSIPYLNKRGIGADSSFAPRAGQNGMPIGSHEM